MRVLGTLLAGIVFAAAAVTLLILTSLSSLSEDKTWLEGIFKKVDVRGRVLKGLEAGVKQALKQGADPAVAAQLLPKVQSYFKKQLTPKWLADIIVKAQRLLVAFLDGKTDVSIDVGPWKKRIRTMLDSASGAIRQACAQLGGDARCEAAVAQTQAVVRRYRGRVLGVLDKLPDNVTLSWLLSDRGLTLLTGHPSPGFRKLERALEHWRSFRWIAYVVLGLSLLFIGFINRSPVQRAMMALGIVIAASAGLYFAAGEVAVRLVDKAVKEEVTRSSAAKTEDQLLARRLVIEVFRDVTERRRNVAFMLLGVGSVLAGAGAIIPRRRAA